jgi:hypothetical protein
VDKRSITVEKYTQPALAQEKYVISVIHFWLGA